RLHDLPRPPGGKRLGLHRDRGPGQADQAVPGQARGLEEARLQEGAGLHGGSQGDTLDETLAAFKADKLHGVVLSKVDEAVKLGPAIDALVRHHVTLRGVANGQRVPEDWHHPDAAALVKLSMGSSGKSAFDPASADMGFYFAQSGGRGVNLGAGGLHV